MRIGDFEKGILSCNTQEANATIPIYNEIYMHSDIRDRATSMRRMPGFRNVHHRMYHSLSYICNCSCTQYNSTQQILR